MDVSLQYPIGKFSPDPSPLTAEERVPLVARVQALPARARAAVQGLDETALDTPYREGGWTPRQIVHHLADSHMNALLRIKLALTEDHPTIKPYAQAAWAELADSRLPVSVSLGLLDGIHARWVAILDAMADGEFARTVEHPEMGPVSVDFFVRLYAWHGDHHATQVEQLRERLGV